MEIFHRVKYEYTTCEKTIMESIISIFMPTDPPESFDGRPQASGLIHTAPILSFFYHTRAAQNTPLWRNGTLEYTNGLLVTYIQ